LVSCTLDVTPLYRVLLLVKRANRTSNIFTFNNLRSNAWLNRQRNDIYVQQAKKEGYRSRAAYKLLDIDEQFGFLKKCTTIVELGAAPG
jgi:predicted rRNA methylase YqxC with S4 and FtsJ domains